MLCHKRSHGPYVWLVRLNGVSVYYKKIMGSILLGVHTHNLQVCVLPDTGRSTLVETTWMCPFIIHLMSTQMHVTCSTVHLDSQSCKCVHPAGPIVILTFSCLFVCLSVQDLGKLGNKSMADSWHVVRVSELAGLFTSSLQKEAKRCQYYRQ